jgi:hypothetical protein
MSCTRRLRVAPVVAQLLLATAAAQQHVWTHWYDDHQVFDPVPYGDLNGDGQIDVAAAFGADFLTFSFDQQIRIFSGVDGAVLWQRSFPLSSYYRYLHSVGDVNGDGVPEMAITFSVHHAFPAEVRIVSPVHAAPLWIAYGGFHENYGVYTIGLNIDGDPQNEVLTTQNYADSSVFAYDHDGTPLYTLPLESTTGEIVRGIGRIGDVDGDGIDDFGIGLIEATGRGAVSVRSGRTGSQIRRDVGTLVGDAIGNEVKSIGDYDRDGIPDYATGSRNGWRGVAVAFSGATGAILREWTGMPGLSKRLIGGVDLDLDGVPDVVMGGPHLNPLPTGGYFFGRVAAFSGRDGGLLWEERHLPGMTEPGALLLGDDRHLGEGLANLGSSGANPYPIVVVQDRPDKILGYVGSIPIVGPRARLRAFRAAPVGTAIQGAGCASAGVPPRIAVRRADGTSSGLRVTVSDVAPSSAAWLLVGLANAAVPLVSLQFGCQLLVSPDLIVARATGAAGWDAGYAMVAAPYQVSAAGLALAAQWLCLDPTTLAVAMTPRHELRIQ